MVKRNINNVHCTECPADFTHIPIVNGCYKVVTRNLQWSAAGLECRGLHKDAHHLVINDAAEQSAIVAMLESTNREYYYYCPTLCMSEGIRLCCYAFYPTPNLLHCAAVTHQMSTRSSA